MSLSVAWVHSQSGVQIGVCPHVIFAHGINGSTIAQSLRQIRIDLKSLLQILLGLDGVFLRKSRNGATLKCERVGAIELDGFGLVCNRLIVVLLERVYMPAHTVRLRMLRIDLQDAVQAVDRSVVFRPGNVRFRSIEMAPYVVGSFQGPQVRTVDRF